MQSKKVTHDSYSTENQEKEDKPKEEEAKEPVAEEKPKTRSSQPKELAPAFMSNIFAALDIYMTKMLVRPHAALSPDKPSISVFFFFHLIIVGQLLSAHQPSLVFSTELPGS